MSLHLKVKFSNDVADKANKMRGELSLPAFIQHLIKEAYEANRNKP